MASNPIPPLSSYSTALVLLPPPHIQSRINPLRSANDKSFPRWTAHVTLVFPFVEASHLPEASSLIKDALSKAMIPPFPFQLDEIGKFKQRDYSTVFLGPSKGADVHRVWSVVSSVVGYTGRPFVPHLTLGQAHHHENSLDFLEGKGKRLFDAAIQWELGSVVILRKSETEGGLMKIYEEITLSPGSHTFPGATIVGLHPTTYHFASGSWLPSAPITRRQSLNSVALATYNVLSDLNHPIAPRIPRLLSNLLSLEPVPDLICLQEVTDEFLRHLLAVPDIQARWPCCTCDPASVLPGERNIVFLGRGCFRYEWEYIYLRGKRKPAIVLRIPRTAGGSEMSSEDQSIVIAGIHLTAGLTSSQQCTKLEELEILIGLLRPRHSNSPWVLVGDFNIPTTQSIPTSITTTFDDAWLTVRGSEDGGATYNPGTNTLARETVKEDRSPQRYDRIWIRRGMKMEVQAVDIFGQGAEEASDHYGLTTTLRLLDSESIGVGRERTLETKVLASDLEAGGFIRSVTAVPVEELEEFLCKEEGFPSEAEHAKRSHVTATLRAVLSSPVRPASVKADLQTSGTTSGAVQSQSAVKFEFIPVGSFGLGVDTQGSDLDILVVGNISPRTFWTLARSRIRRSAPKSQLPGDLYPAGDDVMPGVTLKRFVKEASVQMMELLVGGVCVDMQYCSAGMLLESWDQIQVLPSTDSRFLLPAPSLRTLNAYRDMLHALRVLPTSILPAFRLAHRALKLFCVSQGIYSSRLGYLGGIHITLLLSRVTILSPPNVSASQLLVSFFTSYSEWDWVQQMVTIPGAGNTTTYNRAPAREPMVILSVERPVLNVVQNANKHTTNAITSAFKMACRRLADVCGAGGICGEKFEKNFLHSHDSFIKINLSFWGRSVAKARAWIGFVESRLPHLLVLLQTALPNWSVRLWPRRLIDTINPGNLSTGLQSFYLIGVNAPAGTTFGNGLQTPLFAFEDQLRRNDKYYDAKEMFVSVVQASPSQLPHTITTPLAWPDGGIDPDKEVSDEEEGAESCDEEHDPDAAFTSISAKQLKRRRQKLRASSTSHVSAAKLRTSSDVFNRLVWDRNLQNEEYLIGYEDRFDGLKEMPLGNWTREVEDEAFVPFHRVVHFRRKRDGVLIWDRRKKIDLVFGSGIQQRSF